MGKAMTKTTDRSNATSQSPLNELVFIDAGLSDYQTLLSGIRPTAKVHIIQPMVDGVRFIANVVAQETKIDAIHILSHGVPGETRLGATILNGDTLSVYGQALRTIGQTLNHMGELLFYACHLGFGNAGRQLLNELATLTGATIAASDDATGVGGDWELEVYTGPIATPIVVSEPARQNWYHAMAGEFADMRTWDLEGVSGGTWVDPNNPTQDFTLAASGRSVLQTYNNTAGTMFLLSDETNVINATVTGTLEVNDSDDDWIGFVLGYQNNDGDAFPEEYVGFTWSQGGTSPYGLAGIAGDNSGNVGIQGGQFLVYSDAETLNGDPLQEDVIDSNAGTANEWQSGEQYTFSITYTSAFIKVTVDGALVLEATAADAGLTEFKAGKLGFSNASQANVIFGNIRLFDASTEDSVATANDDNYGIDLATMSNSLSVDRFSGLLANDADPDGDPFNIVIESDGTSLSSDYIFSSPTENVTFTTTAGGSYTVFGDGSFNYTGPASPADGLQDAFTYYLQDADGLSSAATAMVTIFADNTDPTNITVEDVDVGDRPNIIVEGGSAVDTDIATVTVVDGDANDQHDLELVDASGGAFKIVDGVLKVRDTTALDSQTTHTITISATDLVDQSVTVSNITITVDPNALPTSADNSVSLSVNNVVAFSTGDFAFNDADGDPFTSLRINQTPTLGTLFLDANDNDTVDGGETIQVNVNDIIAKADLDAGLLKYTSGTDGSTSFLFSVSDGAAFQASPNTLSLTVNSNSAPTISDITTQTIDEDNGTGVLNFTVGDAESGTAGLIITATSNNQALVPDGNIVLGGSDENRTVTVTPLADANGTATITVTVSDGDLSTSDTFDVVVNAVATTPSLSVTGSASGDEDTAIGLTINATTTDTGDTLTVLISGVPTGATLSAGTDNGDGTWTVPGDQLSGLTITPPADDNSDFTLTVVATGTDGEDSASSNPATINVTVNEVATTPSLSVTGSASGDEDTAIGLTINASTTDTGDTLTVLISGVPTGATLSAGTDNGDGTWTVPGDQLSGLTITPPENDKSDFTLTVVATSTDGEDSASSSPATINVTVNEVAETPSLSVTGSASGDEDSAIGLTIGASVSDPSETVEITISGVPTGATLSAGTDNGDGTWTLTPAQLSGLTITPPADDNSDFTLTVVATSTDGEDSASSDPATIGVTVNEVATTPSLSVTGSASGDEDTAIGLAINASTTDTGDTLTVLISGVPTGATLSAGIDNGDGTWTLTPAQLSGLTITPRANDNSDFTLTVVATGIDGEDSASSSPATIDVTVDAVADVPSLNVTASATGDEDSPIALNVTGSTDDNADNVTVTISNVPDGATLSAGTDNDNGTWTLTLAELEGLTITPPPDDNGTWTLSIVATSTDGANTATSDLLTVNITATNVNDAPAIGEDQAFTIAENSLNGTVIGTVEATDTEGDTLTYSIISGNDNGLFGINPATGEVTIADETLLPDFERNPASYTLGIQVADNSTDSPGPLSSQASITVELADRNEHSDFNGDYVSDFVWRNASADTQGIVFFDNSNNTTNFVSSFALPLNVGSESLVIEGVGDFDGDGKEDDIVWRDYATGQNIIWQTEFENGQVQTTGAIFLPEAPTDWRVDGVGDFDGDGLQDDLVFYQESSKLTVIWLWDEETQAPTGAVITDSQAIPGDDWYIGGVGNFDDDGLQDDLFWRNRVTGQNVVWFMTEDEVSPRPSGSVFLTEINPIWELRGVSDFDGDLQADDLVWYWGNAGQTDIWYMDYVNNTPTLVGGVNGLETGLASGDLPVV
jgi:CDP-diacylglycerol pyrophosphatase